MESAMPRILVFGDKGQVGWELQRTLANLGQVVAIGRNTTPLNIELADLGSVRATIRDVQPQWIVNAAAYTAVDQAEEEEHLALRINGEAPGVMAEVAKELDAGLIHYSTDYVFDGTSRAPYGEEAPASPKSAYGRTKRVGEENIQAVGGKFLILRTSWVYGLRGKNFLLTIQRLAREREELRIVADQIGSPTWCRNIAEATAQVLSQMIVRPTFANEATGVYHLTSAGETSWHGFAEAIIDRLREQEELAVNRVSAIDTTDYPLPAERPQCSVLSNEKIQRVFGVYMPNWDDALKLCISKDR